MKELDFKNLYSHEFEATVEQDMQQAIKHFEQELAKIRSGRAHTSMIEDLKVTCYGGTVMSLKELASLSAPDVRLLVIQPWDKAIINDIEKAILTSDLVGLTPINDGETIKLQLPEISGERREELVKILHKKLEECRVSIRNVRNEFRHLILEAERKHDISEDFKDRLLDTLQKIYDKFMATADILNKKKEQEIRAV